MTLEEQTKALLPCYCNAVDDEPHMIDCPADYRGAVVIALAENNAEIERLSTALGQANADLMGCRDGALVRDLKARVAELEADSDKLKMTEALFNQGLRLAPPDLKHIGVAAKIEGLRLADEIIFMHHDLDWEDMQEVICAEIAELESGK